MASSRVSPVSRLFLVFVALGLPLASHAYKIDFEDLWGLYESNGWGPTSYAGMNWSNNLIVYNPPWAPGNEVMNGRVCFYNGLAHQYPLVMSSPGGTPFTLTSFYGAEVYGNGGGHHVIVTGWSGATQLYSATLDLADDTPAYFSLGWGGIDRVHWATDYNQLCVDDIVLNEGGGQDGGGGTNVPEPATSVLFLAGLIGLKLRRR